MRDGAVGREKKMALLFVVAGELQWWPARLAAAAAVKGGRKIRVRVSCVRWRR